MELNNLVIVDSFIIQNKFSELEKALKSENEKLDKKSKTLQQEVCTIGCGCVHLSNPTHFPPTSRRATILPVIM